MVMYVRFILWILMLVTLIILIFTHLCLLVTNTNILYFHWSADGKPIVLHYNSSAINPTYNQVVDFIRTDKTDEYDYIPEKFTCGNFAKTVYDNAQLSGYKCGIVFIYFVNDDIIHACNVFDTTDRGLIFVDCTSSRHRQIGDDFNTIVNIEKGKEYRSQSIFGYNTVYGSQGIVRDYEICW
jgi:hypothetical protein